jgi:hypothetical protein
MLNADTTKFAEIQTKKGINFFVYTLLKSFNPNPPFKDRKF